MGKKGKKAKKEEAPEECRYDHPAIEPSRLDKREIQATVKLAAPVCTLLEFTAKINPSTKIQYIEDLIVKRHGGSIQNLSICVNRFHPEEIVSSEATLEDCGVVGGECIIYYDFVPVSAALLR